MVWAAFLLVALARAGAPPGTVGGASATAATPPPAVGRALRAWQDSTWSSMAGPRASPLYRDVSNRMDVLWRQVEVGAPAPYLGPDQERQVLDSALAGSVDGLRLSLREAVRANPELRPLARAIDVLAAPDVELRAGPGGPRVRFDAPDEGRAAAQARALDEAAPRASSLRVGGGVALLRAAEPALAEGAAQLQPTLTTWAAGRGLGVDLLRADATLARGTDQQLLGSWTVGAREQLRGGWSLALDARGDVAAASPTRLAVGPELRLPGTMVLAVRVVDPLAGAEDLRFEVGLRSRSAWRLPFPPAAGQATRLPDPTLVGVPAG